MRLRQGDLKFKTNLNYIVRPCLKNTKQTNNKKIAKGLPSTITMGLKL